MVVSLDASSHRAISEVDNYSVVNVARTNYLQKVDYLQIVRVGTEVDEV